jgi:hypothetical protein
MHGETITLAANILARGMTFFTAVNTVGSVQKEISTYYYVSYVTKMYHVSNR